MFESFLNVMLDPSWNAKHRVTIWITIWLTLWISGFGLPLPEDIPMMLSGFTTYKQGGDRFVLWRFVLNFAIVTSAIMLGDLVAYGLGRRYGMALRERYKFFARLMPDNRLERAKRWFHDYGGFTIFMARQLAGVRFVTFYLAGTLRVSVPKFMFWDFLGALISVPVWIGIGALAGRYGRVWMHAASTSVGRYLLLGAVAITLLFFAFVKLRGRKKAEQESG